MTPFGCQCLYIALQTSEAAARRLKFEPRGRTGVVVGYSDLQSYLVLDEHELLANGVFRIFRTRDIRLFPEVFPLRRTPQQFLLANRATMTRPLVGPEKKSCKQMQKM